MEKPEVFYDIKKYMSLPYNFIINYIDDEGEGYYYGRVLELDGCQSTGDTLEELYENIKEAMEGYIETKLENGFDVPKPVNATDYSGKFNVRIPRTLHQRLSFEAEKEGVSLNQYVLYKLAL
ncbi:MAG: toxin-antitoxin system HicB family antitoxin [Clostridiales bacterium]|nr:toxin-antitoxin system HicB family antitoxin [Clostridiales bacterium]